MIKCQISRAIYNCSINVSEWYSVAGVTVTVDQVSNRGIHIVTFSSLYYDASGNNALKLT